MTTSFVCDNNKKWDEVSPLFVCEIAVAEQTISTIPASRVVVDYGAKEFRQDGGKDKLIERILKLPKDEQFILYVGGIRVGIMFVKDGELKINIALTSTKLKPLTTCIAKYNEISGGYLPPNQRLVVPKPAPLPPTPPTMPTPPRKNRLGGLYQRMLA